MKELKQSSNHSSSKNNTANSAGSVTAISEELPDGSIKVGKIQFRTDHVLGKGCEGTFVFKGEFDNRAVAVKRLLPECFVVADREVCLLRESDEHSNVIRYFCMEQDKQFRYIALELCEATLHEYTEKSVLNEHITPAEILSQATAGLEHLHSLHIVHRDIKPHNVLLSVPCKESNKVRVLISDFGLCKKLQSGKISFSRRSGITGTDGWIAPEIMSGKERTTTVVDIFSLGCVFYYVLSKGKHPFGDSLRRQANIINGDYKLNDLVDDPHDLWKHIIVKMITKDPSERPSASVVRCHPAFWDKSTVLSFLQDVSDRIEREDVSSKVLLELEIGNSSVLNNGDWRVAIEPEIAQDLRKHRNYRGDSLRDLLRALRNKKHHYRELSQTVRDILGPIPDGFVSYWTTRFPFLLLHTWLTMQCIKYEQLFCRYYSKVYTFPRTDSTDIPNWILESINTSHNRRLIEYSKNDASFYNSYFNSNVVNQKFTILDNNIDSPDKNLNWRNTNNIRSNNAPRIIDNETNSNNYDDNDYDNNNNSNNTVINTSDKLNVASEVEITCANLTDNINQTNPENNNVNECKNLVENNNVHIFEQSSKNKVIRRYNVRHRSRQKSKRKHILSKIEEN